MTFWDAWESDRVALRPTRDEWYNTPSLEWTDDNSGDSGVFPVAPVVPDYEDFDNCSGVSLGEVVGVTSGVTSDGAFTYTFTFVGRVFSSYDERIISLNDGNWPVETLVSQYYREVSCPFLKFPEWFLPSLPDGMLVFSSVGFRYWWGGGAHLPGKSFEWWRVKNHNSDYSGWFPCINDFLSALPSDPPRIPEDYPYVLVREKKEYGLADMSFVFRPDSSPAAIIPALRVFGWFFGYGGGLSLSPFRGSSARLNSVDSFLDNYRSDYD